MTTTRSLSGLRRSAAVLSAILLLATACGGGEDDATAVDTTAADRNEGSAEPSTDGGTEDAPEVSPPAFSLDEEPAMPAGFRSVPARCDSEDDRGASLALAVPEGWELTSVGSGGSGSALEDNHTLGFRTEGGSVEIEISPDRVDADGTILGPEGEPWESFDYEWSSYGSEGEKSGTVSFDLLDTAELADQQVEIFVAERDQDPDYLSKTDHRARIEMAQIPSFALNNEFRTVSAVVTMTHDPDDVTLGADDVLGIIGSFAIPTCTREQVITQLEVTYGVDLDDDGHISNIEDILGENAPDLEDLIDQD